MLKQSKGTKPAFPQLRKALNLMVEDLDPKDPKDAAYVFSGYAPISIRLVEAALRSVFCHCMSALPAIEPKDDPSICINVHNHPPRPYHVSLQGIELLVNGREPRLTHCAAQDSSVEWDLRRGHQAAAWTTICQETAGLHGNSCR